MAQRVFHGLDPVTPELKEVIYTCTNCLMCQELCGVRDDGFGPWDITVAMREEINEKEGPLEAHRPFLEGLQQHDHPWARPRAQRGEWSNGLGLKKLGSGSVETLKTELIRKGLMLIRVYRIVKGKAIIFVC
jgi:Fe-S oxidoreductase